VWEEEEMEAGEEDDDKVVVVRNLVATSWGRRRRRRRGVRLAVVVRVTATERCLMAQEAERPQALSIQREKEETRREKRKQ